MKYQFKVEILFTRETDEGIQTTTATFNVLPASSATNPLDLNEIVTSLNNSIENFESRGSGWVVARVNHLRMSVASLQPLS
jgi:hypothetical protein